MQLAVRCLHDVLPRTLNIFSWCFGREQIAESKEMTMDVRLCSLSLGVLGLASKIPAAFSVAVPSASRDHTDRRDTTPAPNKDVSLSWVCRVSLSQQLSLSGETDLFAHRDCKIPVSTLFHARPTCTQFLLFLIRESSLSVAGNDACGARTGTLEVMCSCHTVPVHCFIMVAGGHVCLVDPL